MQGTITVQELSTKFLAWCRNHRSPRTVEWYEGHIKSFLSHLGETAYSPAADLKPYHVAEWVDSHSTWGDTFKGGSIIAVKRIYNWGEELGYLDGNPIKKLKKPQAQRRDNHMRPADFENILIHLSERDPFRDIFLFCWHSGCRPQEARHIEPRHVDMDRERIVFPKEESKGKRKARVIYLQGVALDIIRRLMAQGREGKLFLNCRRTPWTKYALCNRMHRLSIVTGKRMAMYDARHGFATRKLIQGHDSLTVAALMGHTDGSMLAKVYSHIDQDDAHLKRALVD